jgi:release factor glutamine methyltransferase
MSACPPLTFAECIAALAVRGDESRSLAELLWAAATGRSRLDVYREPERSLAGEPAARVRAWVDALRAGAPLQYVLGWTEFRGRRFDCDRRALIPRPETEELADRILSGPIRTRRHPAIADIGTGSGCLAVTLALERPDARIIATDACEDALALARENAARHGVRERIEWKTGDLLSPIEDQSLDLLAANLPYVDADEWARLPPVVREYEPRMALDGGPAGLGPLKRLAADAPRALRPGGAVALEIGEDQADAVGFLLRKAGFEEVRLHRDLAGRPRFACARWGGARPCSNP